MTRGLMDGVDERRGTLIQHRKNRKDLPCPLFLMELDAIGGRCVVLFQ